jgi:hypothetical protein
MVCRVQISEFILSTFTANHIPELWQISRRTGKIERQIAGIKVANTFCKALGPLYVAMI